VVGKNDNSLHEDQFNVCIVEEVSNNCDSCDLSRLWNAQFFLVRMEPSVIMQRLTMEHSSLNSSLPQLCYFTQGVARQSYNRTSIADHEQEYEVHK
jgi:hypothetical protein